LKTPEEVREGFKNITKNVKSHLFGDKEIYIAVQKMVEEGTEIILGMKRDEVFGPTILFGLGGVWVEVLKDVSLRVSPLSEKDIDEMISEIKGGVLLGNFRGSKSRDISAIKRLILKLEQLASDFPEICEIDLNPVFLKEEGKGATIGDARIVLRSDCLISTGMAKK
jgi:acetate---CoA ligase (ADP-forming) subunit beta